MSDTQQIENSDNKEEVSIKNETVVDDNVADVKKPKKREWTAKREEAWQKCLEGRKKSLSKKSSIVEHVDQLSSLEAKLVNLKNDIRMDLEKDLSEIKLMLLERQKKKAKRKHESSDDSEESSEDEVEKTKKEKKKLSVAEENRVIRQSYSFV